MSINLSTYSAVEAAMFCRIDVPDYDVLLFSNYNIPVTIGTDTYTNLGTLLSVTDSTSDLRATGGTLSISISGIPDSSIAEVLAQKFKGSTVQVWRVFFDANTKQQLSITGNPAGRFQGIITNYALEEDWQMGAKTTSNRIMFTASSTVDVLNNKVAGRRTNSNDQKKYFPNDLSMDRVTAITKSNFNFGAVIK